MTAADMGPLGSAYAQCEFHISTRHAPPILGFRKASFQGDPSDGAAPGFDVPYIFRGAGEVKVGAADFGQRPLSYHGVTLSQ